MFKENFDGLFEHLNPEAKKVRQLMSPVVRKPVFRVSNQVQHKLGCEDCYMPEILDLGGRGIVLSM